jgi:hypothetical protein
MVQIFQSLEIKMPMRELAYNGVICCQTSVVREPFQAEDIDTGDSRLSLQLWI